MVQPFNAINFDEKALFETVSFLPNILTMRNRAIFAKYQLNWSHLSEQTYRDRV